MINVNCLLLNIVFMYYFGLKNFKILWVNEFVRDKYYYKILNNYNIFLGSVIYCYLMMC